MVSWLLPPLSVSYDSTAAGGQLPIAVDSKRQHVHLLRLFWRLYDQLAVLLQRGEQPQSIPEGCGGQRRLWLSAEMAVRRATP